MVEPIAEEGGLADNLSTLLESGVGADVTLVVGGSELPAHSVVLAARSPVFAAMLRHDMQESRTRRIEVTDMQEAVLKQLLQFIYTDTAPQLDNMAVELLSASDKYDLPLLKKRCEQKMARDLTVDNAAATAVLAELHSCPLLKSAAVDFVRNRLEVMATDGWMHAMRCNVEAATQICKKVALAPQSSQNRILSEEHKQNLSKKLLKAASQGSVDEVWALLEAGAPVNAKDDEGNTALHLALHTCRTTLIKMLIDAGADVNARNSSQMTPLHSAVRKNYGNTIWMLLAAAAHIDARDDKGNTPLHLAANSCRKSVEILLVAGAKRNIKNTEGYIPMDMAGSHTRSLFDIC